jgi:hypothetical protein
MDRALMIGATPRGEGCDEQATHHQADEDHRDYERSALQWVSAERPQHRPREANYLHGGLTTHVLKSESLDG